MLPYEEGLTDWTGRKDKKVRTVSFYRHIKKNLPLKGMVNYVICSIDHVNM